MLPTKQKPMASSPIFTNDVYASAVVFVIFVNILISTPIFKRDHSQTFFYSSELVHNAYLAAKVVK